MTATLDANPDVNVGKAILAQQEDGLLQLELQSTGLNQLQGATVHLNIKINKYKLVNLSVFIKTTTVQATVQKNLFRYTKRS